MTVVAFSLHQRHAPLEARERLLDRLEALAPSRDRLVLATCHRVEIYTTSEREPEPLLERREGLSAIRHLFRVTAGLDSAIPGESQIAGQVRGALRGAGDLDPLLRAAFERALAVARIVRRDLDGPTTTLGSLAVDELLGHLAEPSRATVLVLGAGEMGALAVRALGRRVGSLIVANRDVARARAAAPDARCLGLDELGPVIASVDGIISAADTRGSLLTSALLRPVAAARPLALVDLAMPRSVPEDARGLPGLLYRSVDDLVRRITDRRDVTASEIRCATEADRFLRSWAAREAGRAILALRAHADRIRRQQLERALNRLGHLAARDRAVVEALSLSLMNALIHRPTVALRADPARESAARALFGIEGEVIS